MQYAPKGRILLVKLADLGDAVLLSAAVDALATALPAYALDLLVGTAGAAIFERDERVRRVWAFDRRRIEGRRAFTPRSLLAWGRLLYALRRERYAAVLLAHHLTTRLGALKLASVALAAGAPLRVGLLNGRGWFLTHGARDGGFGAAREGEYWVRLTGVLADALAGGDAQARALRGRLGVRVGADAQARAGELLPQGMSRPVVALHHGLGGWMPSRAWTAEGYARVADVLHARLGGMYLLVGGPEERTAAEAVAALAGAPVRVLAGETDVRGLVSLLTRCDLYVGPDSGPMQLAAALGVPVVSLWGPTNERAWGPSAALGAGPAVCLRAPDRPRPWVYVGRRMGEPQRPGDLGSLEPDAVAEAALGLLAEGGYGAGR